MAYALINSSGDRDYHECVLRFLEEIEPEKVRGVVMVAITEAGPYLSWDCNNVDFAAAASMVQAQATVNYQIGILEEDDDEDCD